MKLMKTTTTALTTIIDGTGRAITVNVPLIGKSAFHLMATTADYAESIHRERLIESEAEKKALYKEHHTCASAQKRIELALAY